jgi:vacuolar-type H+-ATPase subunit E/Vma4
MTGDEHPTGGSTPDGTPPDNVQELTAEIERTREELGETIEALAAKADVKARAKDLAADARKSASATAGQVKQQVAGQAARARAAVREATPPQVRRAADQAGQAVSETASDPTAPGRPRALMAAVAVGAVALAGWLIIRRRRK